jgi:hypothetical protein
MQGLPTELLYLLIFGAVLLFNFFTQRAARRRQAEAQQQQEEAQDDPAPDEPIPDFWGRAPGSLETFPVPATPAEPIHRPALPIDSAVRRRKRFSKASLFGTKRDVQNAVVIATILGPCRGSEPPGAAPTSAAAEILSGRVTR